MFDARGERFEWKLHGHDLPADLPERLRAAGFEPEELETIVIAPVDGVAGEPVLPDGVSLREVTGGPTSTGSRALEEAVWDEAATAWLADSLEAELALIPTRSASSSPRPATGRLLRLDPVRGGTDFATLWGGATLAAWRGRGIYRATVPYRANLAAERGPRYLQVDASDGQPADPRAARLRARDDDDALRLVARLSHDENDVSRLLPGLDVPRRLDDVLERIAPVDDGAGTHRSRRAPSRRRRPPSSRGKAERDALVAEPRVQSARGTCHRPVRGDEDPAGSSERLQRRNGCLPTASTMTSYVSPFFVKSSWV